MAFTLGIDGWQVLNAPPEDLPIWNAIVRKTQELEVEHGKRRARQIAAEVSRLFK